MSTSAKSIPKAHSAPIPHAAEAVTPIEPAVANVPATTDATDTQPVSSEPKKSLVYPLALTVLAILPIALGIGAARVKMLAASAHAISSVIDEKPDTDDSMTTTPTTDRRIGDRHFLERRYEVALQYYRSLGSSEPDRLPSELLYRIALCQEALGMWDDSLASQRTVAELTDNSVLRAAACFGQARIWFRLNEPSRAETLLRSLEFQADVQHALPSNLTREIRFLIPLALAQKTVSKVGRFENRGPAPLGDLMIWSLEPAFAWADPLAESIPSIVATSTGVPDPVPLSEIPFLRVRPPKTTSTSTASADDWMIDICCESQSLKTIVMNVSNECGLILEWPQLVSDPSLERTVSLSILNRPFGSLLTTICSELQSSWSIEEGRLVIARDDADGHRSRHMIARTLELLTNENPNDRLADHARFARAQLAQHDGDVSQAAVLFSSLVKRDSTPLATRAAYNSAVNYYWLGDFTRACTQLGYVVNGSPENPLHVESMILLGRLLLERGEAQDAVFQLRRATEARGRPHEQARAAVLLGMSFLVQEKYQEAAEAVFASRLLFDEPKVRNAAAFVTTFARWQAINGEMKEREATFLYRAMLTMKTDSEWLGQCGQLLIGRAYVELGFDEHMYDAYVQAMTIGVTEFVEAEMTYTLANYERANDRIESAKALWETLANRDANRWTNLSRFKLAEVALAEGRAKDSLEICEQVHASDGISRADIQKLMGRAFELLGEDALAARCYAGQLPTH